MTKKELIVWCEARERIDDEGYPHLPAVVLPNDQITWRVWCRYCKKFHTHGAGPGHRVAHCHDRYDKRRNPWLRAKLPDSLYQIKGYYLDYPDDAEMRAKLDKVAEASEKYWARWRAKLDKDV